MTLLPEIQSIISEEEKLLAEVLTSLQSQLRRSRNRFSVENSRARALTSELVAFRRAEDKWQAASDEAVAHSLSDLKLDDVATIEKLLERPYFGRMIVSEEQDDGSKRTIEFKLGTAANPECRIIDWRKAPRAKLFYEYKEGDEYVETIQNAERFGHVELRRSIDIKDGKIWRIQCSKGTFEYRDNQWTHTESSEVRAVSRKNGAMPDVFSLITAEQFKLITVEADGAVLIQGIAGSGKTTVALHRLAWLLAQPGQDIKPEDVLIVVRSSALRTYIVRSLEVLELVGVRCLTISEFFAEIVAREIPELAGQAARTISAPSSPCPRSIDRLKSSTAILLALEKYARENKDRSTWTSYYDDLVRVLRDDRAIMERDKSSLINRELIAEGRVRSEENARQGCLDLCDAALIVRLIELKRGTVPRTSGHYAPYKHLVIDEAQDLSPVELAALLGAVDDISHSTIVGDKRQQTSDSHSFPGWEALTKFWSEKERLAHFVELSVSFRSTQQIMQFASSIIGEGEIRGGRSGRIPIWFRARGEQSGIEAARGWLERALERYPTDLTAVLCANITDAKRAVDMLRPTFGNGIRLGDEHSFSFEAGIVVAPAVITKGLEFVNVLLWNPSSVAYPQTEISRNLLYLAATRAEENLCLVTWNAPCSFLPRSGSSLVRFHEAE